MTALAQFGTSRLSDREAEVARLILQGHSSKAIARILGNSPETVKFFRKRIHTKLGLASSAELFSLFLTALCAAPQGTNDDPLVHLT
jgi:DNA-binding CsgD family transcriptional regulator